MLSQAGLRWRQLFAGIGGRPPPPALFGRQEARINPDNPGMLLIRALSLIILPLLTDQCHDFSHRIPRKAQCKGACRVFLARSSLLVEPA